MLDFNDFVDEFDAAIDIWSEYSNNLEDAIVHASDELIFEFIETLFLVTKYYFSTGNSQESPFSFTANSALSGLDSPCASLECRLLKIDQMLSFSSLYADEVFLRNPFEYLYNICKTSGVVPKVRVELQANIVIYKILRPYFKIGIIKYANSIHSFCPNHLNKVINPYKDKLHKNENILYSELEKHFLKKVSVNYNEYSRNEGYLTFKGPSNLIEHNKLHFHLYNNEGKDIDYMRMKGLPYKMKQSKIQEENILHLLLNPILDDITFHNWHSKFYNTNLLINNDLQFNILNKINVNALNTNVLTNQFKYNLTVTKNTTPESIIKLRQANEEYFHIYRERTKQFFKTVKGLNSKEQEEAFSDLVRSEIINIDRNLRSHKEKYLSKTRQNIIFGSGIVAIGSYLGIIPTDISTLIATIGGTAALSSSATELNQLLQPDNIAKDNDFYFLWKLQR
ncbi:hypothetical protein [Aliivibrio fischeri]|uniref:hypothetical protein n=1 Tax=Aliivibrio fischeri TaxID=668 RepID=UPI00354B57D4